MPPTLKARLRGLMTSQAAAPRALAIQSAGVLLLAGGLLGLTSAALPPAARGSEAVIVGTSAIAALAGLVLLLSRPYVSDRGLALAALCGTALITIAPHQGGTKDTADNEILFLWICLYSFYFLSLPVALAQMGAVGAAYAFLLGAEDVTMTEAITRWLVTMTALVVAGIVISRLRGGVYQVVGELSARASVDPLTGLLNRTSAQQRFEQERQRADREGAPVSVLAVDVDEFKALNDTLGHPVGDEALRQVSAALRHWTRRLDLVARLGGDELAVVLPGAGPGDALSVAEDIRSAIARSQGPQDLRLTVSVGVASAEAPIPSFEELWSLADGAMYESKRAGGDRVTVHGARGNGAATPGPTPWDPRRAGPAAEASARRAAAERP